MTLKELLKSKIFKINAIAFAGITLFLMILAMFFLRIYTDHGDSVTIPDLKGRTSEQVSSILDDLNLRFQIRDSVYSNVVAPGTVLDQFPKYGMKVKENRTIFITLCALNQVEIPMPQLTDISYRQATNLIESTGLIAGKVEYKASEYPNLVLEQKVNGRTIRVGEMIAKGSVIDLVLGSASNGETSQVPSLFGHNLTEGKLILGEAFLSLGVVSYDESYSQDELEAKGLIWKQTPDPANIFDIARGTTIDIWLTLDPAKLQAKPDTIKTENSFF